MQCDNLNAYYGVALSIPKQGRIGLQLRETHIPQIRLEGGGLRVHWGAESDSLTGVSRHLRLSKTVLTKKRVKTVKTVLT